MQFNHLSQIRDLIIQSIEANKAGMSLIANMHTLNRCSTRLKRLPYANSFQLLACTIRESNSASVESWVLSAVWGDRLNNLNLNTSSAQSRNRQRQRGSRHAPAHNDHFHAVYLSLTGCFGLRHQRFDIISLLNNIFS